MMPVAAFAFAHDPAVHNPAQPLGANGRRSDRLFDELVASRPSSKAWHDDGAAPRSASMPAKMGMAESPAAQHLKHGMTMRPAGSSSMPAEMDLAASLEAHHAPSPPVVVMALLTPRRRWYTGACPLQSPRPSGFNHQGRQ